MDIRQRINRFNTENRPFYIVDHDSGEYSLCLAFSFLDGEYKEFGQDAFNRYALEINEPVVDGRGMFIFYFIPPMHIASCIHCCPASSFNAALTISANFSPSIQTALKRVPKSSSRGRLSA